MIFRNRSPERFTTVPNETLRDKDLTDAAGWLLLNLLSNADDWKISIKGLELDGRFGGHEKISKNLKLLRLLGYARMTRLHTGETIWDFTDTKAVFLPDSEAPRSEKPNSENRIEGEPHSEKPNSENRNAIRNNNKTKNKPPLPPFDPFAIDLPYCLSSDQWRRWVEFRRTIRKPINQSTADEQIRKLIAWSREGHDPNEILATSIANSWQGIFKPKVFESHGQRQDNSAPAKVKRAIAERDARRKAESLGAIGDPGAIEGEFERISF